MSANQLPSDHALRYEKQSADIVISEIFEEAKALFESIKKERQHELKFRVDNARENGDADRVRKAKKNVDNQASSEAGRIKQKFLIERFSDVVRGKINEASHLVEENARLQAKNQNLMREIELLRRWLLPDSQCIPAHTQQIPWSPDVPEHSIMTNPLEHCTPLMNTSMQQNSAHMTDTHWLNIPVSQVNIPENGEIVPYIDTESVTGVGNGKIVTNGWDYFDLSSNPSMTVRAQMRNDNPVDIFPRGA